MNLFRFVRETGSRTLFLAFLTRSSVGSGHDPVNTPHREAQPEGVPFVWTFDCVD